MKEPPSATFPHVLEDLYTLPGEFIACLEWRRIPNDRMRRTLQLRRRHFFNKRVSMVNYVSPETRPDEMLVDESASATVRQLGDALTELEVQRPLLRRVLALAGPLQRGRARPRALGRRSHQGDGQPRRRVHRRNLQPPERLARHRPRQQRAQPSPSGAARDELRRPELPLHPGHRASRAVRT